MAQDFLNQSDRDVQRLVEDLEDVIRSPLESDMATVKQENLLDGFGNDQFINQMLQSNNNGSDLPVLDGGLGDDLGMDTDMKPSINPLNNPSPADTSQFSPTSNDSSQPSTVQPVYHEQDETYPFAGTWNKVRGFLEENIQLFQGIYGSQFPIQFVQIRSHFSDPIEKQKWHLIDPDDYGQAEESLALEIVRNLLQAMQRRCEETLEVDQKLLFYNLGTWFQNVYGNNPMELVRMVKKVLSVEQMIIQNATQSQQGSDGSQQSTTQEKVNNRHQEINNQLEQCTKITQETETQLQKVCRLQEYMMITRSHLEVYAKLAESGQLSQEQRQQWQSEAAKHQEYENNLVSLRKEIIKNHEKIIGIMQDLHGQVVYTETRGLERSQAAAYNGAPQYSSLEQCEQWYQRLAEIIWRSLRQLVHLEGQHIPIRDGQNPLPNMKSSYVSFLGSLVERGLVIEKQPPQVLMKDKRFVGTLRHLVGDKLDIHKVAFQVRAHLVSDENARRILAKGEFIGSGKIVNHTVMTEYHEHSRILQANFRNMTLRDKGRGDRRGTESVAEEKFSIVFQADIIVRSPACEFTVTAQTLSLPVVVISHGKQEANAAATIFWDNAFSEENRVPYHVPERVPWGRFMEAIDHKWQSECRTKVGLKKRARDYLASKIFGRSIPDNQDFCWRQLNRDNLPGHTFTFWQWFYSVLELTKSRYIQPHWNSTAIEGFISKTDCQQLLIQKGPGTFMLRYSDSKLGGISTAYAAADENGVVEVKHLEPDTLKILQVRSLADMVKDFSQLHRVFPDRPKHECFSKFYTSKPASDGPYVKKTLVAHIEET